MATIEHSAAPNGTTLHLSGEPLSSAEWVRVRALFPYDVIARIASVPDRIEVTSWRTAILSPEIAYQRLRAAIEVARSLGDDGEATRWLLTSNVELSGLAPVQILSAGDPSESLQRLLAALDAAAPAPPSGIATSRTDAA